MAEELWQAYNEQGEPLTDRPLIKSDAAREQLHGAAHIWIHRRNGGAFEVLVQKRASHKRTWPDFYDISAAGHIMFGEQPLETAIREMQEELQISVNPADLRLLFTHQQYMKDEVSGAIENELQWIYGYLLKEDEVVEVGDEVDSVVWMSLAELQDVVAGKTDKQFVPHGEAYFAELFKEITRSR